MRQIFLSIFILAAFGLQAQVRYQEVVDRVAQSPLVEGFFMQAGAATAEAYAEPLLANPEIEGGYFFGSPSTIGNRWDLGVSMEFAFPTAYKHKKTLRQLQANGAMQDFVRQRMVLCREAQDLCADLVYLNGLAQLHYHSLTAAAEMESLYLQRLDAGDCSVLDYKRVSLEYAQRYKDYSLAVAERDMLLNDLRVLCSDTSLSFDQSQYQPVLLSNDFQQYVERHPEVVALRLQLAQDSAALRLARAQRLPSLSIGYASENEAAEAFRGIKAGVALPLWNNKGQQRRADLAMRTTQMALNNTSQRTLNHLQGLYNKALSLQQHVAALQGILTQDNGEALLKKAFDANEITLERYLLDMAQYTEMRKSLLEVQRELEHTVLALEEVQFYKGL